MTESADPRVTIATAPSTDVLVSVSRYQIPDFATPLYRVSTPKGSTTEIKPTKVLEMVRSALGVTKRTRTAKPAAAKPTAKK